VRTAAEAAHFQVFGEEETGRSADSVAEAHIFAVYIRKAGNSGDSAGNIA